MSGWKDRRLLAKYWILIDIFPCLGICRLHVMIHFWLSNFEFSHYKWFRWSMLYGCLEMQFSYELWNSDHFIVNFIGSANYTSWNMHFMGNFLWSFLRKLHFQVFVMISISGLLTYYITQKLAFLTPSPYVTDLVKTLIGLYIYKWNTLV